jgi:hypothetical protein
MFLHIVPTVTKTYPSSNLFNSYITSGFVNTGQLLPYIHVIAHPNRIHRTEYEGINENIIYKACTYYTYC